MEYVLHLLVLIAFYTLLAQSLNLSAGLTGLISLSHAGYYGIGAYSAAIISQQFHSSFWINLPIAMLISLICSLFISLIVVRTVDDYLIICTLGVQVILFSVMNNWNSLTNGPLGIRNIPPISLLGVSLDNKTAFLLLSVFFVGLIWYLLSNIFGSEFGKTLRGINEDEIYVKSIGKKVLHFKVVSYAMSAALAAVPGALYAHYVSYIEPSIFTVSESLLILSIVIIGGMGSLTGSFVASAFMVVVPEALRFIGMPNNIAANLRQIIYGLILILLMMRGKNGLKEILTRNVTN